MRILALDSTNPTGSMAVVEASGEDGRVLVQRAGDPARPQAERLPGDLLAVLTEARVALHDVDVLAVASGPGSFTGLRIGIACMQGLAAVLRRQIVAVSVLEAVAHQASRDLAVGQLVGVWVDARRRDVFAALYRVGPGRLFSRERLIEVEGPSVGPAAAVLERWTAGGASVPSWSRTTISR